MKKIERTLLIAAIILGSFTAYILGYATGMNQLIGVATTPQLQTPANELGLAVAVNKYRTEHGLPALAIADALNQSAQTRADEIAKAGKDARQHTRPDGTNWTTTVPTTMGYVEAGENLVECAVGTGAAVQSWDGSPGHKATMLGQSGGTDWQYIGQGQAVDPTDNCTVYVTHFARDN